MLFVSLVLSSINFVCFLLFVFLCLFTITTQFIYAKFFPLHDTQPNRTNFSFSNSRTLVNRLVDHWSCAMASFWDFKIICAPSIISKTVHLCLLQVTMLNLKYIIFIRRNQLTVICWIVYLIFLLYLGSYLLLVNHFLWWTTSFDFFQSPSGPCCQWWWSVVLITLAQWWCSIVLIAITEQWITTIDNMDLKMTEKSIN